MLTGDAHRSFVRDSAGCPTCDVAPGEYCVSEETGGRRLSNHSDRVTAATGQDLATVDWIGSRKRAAARARGNHAGRPALRKRAPGGW